MEKSIRVQISKISTVLVGLSSFILMTSDGHGAIDRAVAMPSKRYAYIEHGTVVGGESGTAFTLLDLRRIHSPKDKIERILLDLGDADGKPLKNKVSYFQVSLDRNSPLRVTIDLPQMMASGVNAQKLQAAFKSSPTVKEARINYDPVDTTITIQLLLKKPIQLEVFKLPSANKASRIAIDIKEKV